MTAPLHLRPGAILPVTAGGAVGTAARSATALAAAALGPALTGPLPAR